MSAKADASNPSHHLLSTSFDMTDDALVTFGAPVGADAVSFDDVGYMPINALTIAGLVPGISAPLESGLAGAFVQYSAEGLQYLANGQPTTAQFTQLHYQLVGYTGHAVFGHAADGTPTVSGLINQVVLAQGDLIAGQLNFNASGAITGEVDVTVKSGVLPLGRLDVSVQHAAGDVGHTATGGLTLSNGNLVGTFIPSVGV
jgi:hypothetical protein